MDRLLSIVVVNFNTTELLGACLRSLEQHLVGVDFECVVVDNASTVDGFEEVVAEHAFCRALRLDSNVGFGAGSNAGVAVARGDVLLLLNPDTELVDGSVASAVHEFARSMPFEIQGLGLLWPDGSFQNSFSTSLSYSDYLFAYGPLWRIAPGVQSRHKYGNREPGAPFEVGVVYGTAMLMRRCDYVAADGFDDAYFMYFEDVDFCDRFRSSGGAVVQHPEARVVHCVRASSGGARNAPSPAYLESKYLYGRRRFGSLAVLPARLADRLAAFIRR